MITPGQPVACLHAKVTTTVNGIKPNKEGNPMGSFDQSNKKAVSFEAARRAGLLVLLLTGDSAVFR